MCACTHVLVWPESVLLIELKQPRKEPLRSVFIHTYTENQLSASASVADTSAVSLAHSFTSFENLDQSKTPYHMCMTVKYRLGFIALDSDTS